MDSYQEIFSAWARRAGLDMKMRLLVMDEFRSVPNIEKILELAIENKQNLEKVRFAIERMAEIRANQARQTNVPLKSKILTPRNGFFSKIKDKMPNFRKRAKPDPTIIDLEPVTVKAAPVRANNPPKVRPPVNMEEPPFDEPTSEVILDEYGNPEEGQQGTYIADNDEPTRGKVVNDERYVGPGKVKAKGKPAKKNKMVWIGIIVGAAVLIVVLIFAFLNPNSGSTSYYPSPSGTSDPSRFSPTDEVMPVLDNPNPLDFRGRALIRGFAGLLQFLILVEGIAVLVQTVLDSVTREQVEDAIATILLAAVSIFIVPTALSPWIACLFYLVILGFVIYIAKSGGLDFTPIAGYFLIVGVWGGLIFSRIGIIQAIFPKMVVSHVLPLVQLGVKFELMAWSEMAFPLVVYFHIIIGLVFSTIESFRKSDDGSSQWGSLIAAGIGLVIYFVFLHAIHLTPWISYLIAILASVAMAFGGKRALTGNQFKFPKLGIRSPYDGAMLVTAVLLLLQIIFGTVGIPGL
jgi:uncharacterized integral membrane protein